MLKKRKIAEEEEDDEEEESDDDYDDEEEMVKNAVSKEETLPKLPSQEISKQQYIEREVNLSLINDKLNYIISKLGK